MLLDKKVIVVTGAGSGIGAAAAAICAQAGAKVMLSGRRAGELEAVRDHIRQAGGTASLVVADVSNEGDVAAMVARTVAEFGRLDGAFNNAGVGMHNKPTAELDAEEWDQVMNTNARGVFLCVKHEILAMHKGGGGAIVNNSSIDSAVAIPGWTEYTASKHAVNGITRGAAAETGRTGVRVNAVLPGYIVTPMSERLLSDPDLKELNEVALDRHSVGRFGQPDDVGYAVKWLLSDEAAFVNGAMIPIDGGYTAR